MSTKKPAQRRHPAGTTSLGITSLGDAILAAGDKAGGKGGTVSYLEWLAEEDPRAFCALLGKLLNQRDRGHGAPDNLAEQLEAARARVSGERGS